MKTRFVVLIAAAAIALGVGLGASMQAKPEEKPRSQVTHRPIDTDTLSRFLGCYCHDLSIQKDAIATYRKCELQVVPSNRRVQAIWRDEKLSVGDDAYRVVVMIKPSDGSKTFNTSPRLDVYVNGMTQEIDNPFFGLLKEIGIAITKAPKLVDGRLFLFKWEGKTEGDPQVSLRLQFE
jgi:hypothetical protein